MLQQFIRIRERYIIGSAVVALATPALALAQG